MPDIDPARAARDAASGIRRINHATAKQKVPAPQVSTITGELLTLARRLPQTLEQLRAQLRARQLEGRIRMDTGESPADAVGLVAAAFEDALRAADELERALERAFETTFHMAAE